MLAPPPEHGVGGRDRRGPYEAHQLGSPGAEALLMCLLLVLDPEGQGQQEGKEEKQGTEAGTTERVFSLLSSLSTARPLLRALRAALQLAASQVAQEGGGVVGRAGASHVVSVLFQRSFPPLTRLLGAESKSTQDGLSPQEKQEYTRLVLQILGLFLRTAPEGAEEGVFGCVLVGLIDALKHYPEWAFEEILGLTQSCPVLFQQHMVGVACSCSALSWLCVLFC